MLKKPKIQIIISITLKIFSLILNLYLLKILYLSLSSDDYALWVLLFSIASILSLFDYGITNALIFYLSKKKYSSIIFKNFIVSNSFVILFFIVSVALLFYFIFSYFISFSQLFSISIFTIYNFNYLTLLFLLLVCFILFSNLANAVLYSNQITALVGTPAFFGNILFIILIKLNNSIEGSLKLDYVVQLYFISNLVVSVLFILFTFISFKELTPNIISINKRILFSIFKTGTKYFLMGLSFIFVTSIDIVLMPSLIGLEYINEFSIYQRIYIAIWSTLSLVVIPLWPRLLELSSLNQIATLISEVKNRLYFVLMISFSLLLVLIFNVDTLIKIWLDKKLYPNYILLNLFSLFVLFSVVNNLFSIFYQSINKINKLIYFNVISCLAKVPILYFCYYILNFGVYSFLISTLIIISPQLISGFYILYKK